MDSITASYAAGEGSNPSGGTTRDFAPWPRTATGEQAFQDAPPPMAGWAQVPSKNGSGSG